MSVAASAHRVKDNLDLLVELNYKVNEKKEVSKKAAVALSSDSAKSAPITLSSDSAKSAPITLASDSAKSAPITLASDSDTGIV